MRQFVHTTLAVSLAFLVFNTPSNAQEKKPATEEKITYEQHILPIFREKCGTCHNPNDKNGDLALDNYQSALQGGASGEVIRIDGDAENSTLYRVVSHLSEPFMPPEQPKLPDAQIALIKKWIEQGALQNAGSPARPKKANVTRVEVSTTRPAGPPPMPESLPVDPLLVTSRANGVTAMASSPWAPLVAVSGHKQILLYHTSTLDLVGVLPFPEGQPHVMKFSRNGSILMVGGGRGAHSGKVVLFNVRTGEREAEIGDEYDVVLAADVSPDQTMVALGGPKKMVRCFSVATGEQIYEMKKHTDWVTALEFSPDGVLLATGDRSNGLIVWEAGTGREFYTLNGHTAAVSDISWAPDSNVLASSSEDGSVRLWEMQNGNQVKNWAAHGGGTLSMDFSRDARIVSTGRDLRGKLWDSNGSALKTFEPAMPDLGTAATVCAETDQVLIGDLTGTVHVYQAKDGTKVGELTTNPETLANRIAAATKQLQTDEAAATQATARLAALNKAIADRKQAAENSAKEATEAVAALEAAKKAKTQADAALATSRREEDKSNDAISMADKERKQAVAEVEKAKAVLNGAQKAAKSAEETLTQATANAVKAAESAAAQPEDTELKKAAETATQAKSSAEEAVAAAKQKVEAAEKALTDANGKLSAQDQKLAAAKMAKEKATAARVNAEKQVAAAAAQIQTAANLSNMKNAEAAKAKTAAVVTPEQQKQLSAAEEAAKSAAAKLTVSQQRVSRLKAAAASTAKTAAK